MAELCHVSPKSPESRMVWQSPDWCGSVGRALFREVKGCQFGSWSGHMPGSQFQSLVGVHTRGNRWMFLSHIGVSRPLLLPPLSLKINKFFLKNGVQGT